MKLQPASQKELVRIAAGTIVCSALMLAVFAVLGALGVVAFGAPVVLGALGGTAVAIINFAVLCLTVQNIAAMPDQKNARAKMQLSYNGRLMFQAAWCVFAYMLPFFQVFAGVIPLLFPRIVIYFLQATGRYSPPTPAAPTTDAAPDPDGEDKPNE